MSSYSLSCRVSKKIVPLEIGELKKEHPQNTKWCSKFKHDLWHWTKIVAYNCGFMTVCILFLSQANICILENISMPWFQIFHLTWCLNFLKIILLARNSRHLKLFEPRVYTKEPAKQLFNLYNWRRLCVFRQYCNAGAVSSSQYSN